MRLRRDPPRILHPRAPVPRDRNVDIVGTYIPLESGFNYKVLGVVPKPVSAYK